MKLRTAFVEEPKPVSEGLRDPHLLKAIFLGGAGGSGKTLVSDAMFGGSGLKIVSADKHLERFLRLAGIPFAEVGQEYGLFAKARDAMKLDLRHYAQRRLGLIVDSTAWAYDRVVQPAKKLRALGYDLFMLFVTTSLETALARNRARAEKGGRFVPDSFVEDAWRGAHRNLTRYAKFFGPKNMRIIENDVEVDVDDWVAVIKPKLRNIGQRILQRPLRNPIGKKWLKAQENPATRTIDKPGKSEWPKPNPPPPFKKPKSKRKPKGKGNPFGPPPAQVTGRIGEDLVPLPSRCRNFVHAVRAAISKAPETGPLFISPQDTGFVVEAEMPGGEYYAKVTPGVAVFHARESDGVYVPITQFKLQGRRVTSGPPDTLLPIPLEEKHWRDNPKDFRTRFKITPEKANQGDDVCSIGKSGKNGKFYGWSHRAFSGFGKGDKFFPKLTYHGEWTTQEQDDWEKKERGKQPKIKTDQEARQSAVNFANWVS
jgi:predicted ABC-type ATPase